jgi:hypothetical protein
MNLGVIKKNILFTVMFYLSLLCLRSLTTLVFLIFDNYLISKEFNNLNQFSENEFNFYLINAIVSNVLTILFAVFIIKKIKISKLLVFSSLIIALIFFRVTYLNIFGFFTFFQNPYVNLIILSILSMVCLLGLVKKTNDILSPV